MLTTLYLVGALVTVFGALLTNLLSQRPRCWLGHLLTLARFGIFASAAISVARVLQHEGTATLEQAVMMVSLAVLFAAQAVIEVRRQRKA
ncbi:hypothetical protein QLQ15_17755 [Lysobacter sp. LF1]|uniref:Uncharacterized protein n=1 Tax=Lysobacter stagni TaxID=3045172 RepID=A0ABT6XKT3_9GAMM|nr:hypothetical protein [Lysobacter sp. LF1]MDI9240752.1 hypothetical protein [Lysobacter sp. LF1]